MVKFRMPTEEEVAQAERQYTWRTQSIEKLTAARAERLRELEDQEDAIRRALGAYRGLPDPDVGVRLRSEFIALRKARKLPPSLGGPEPEQPPDRATLLREDYRTGDVRIPV